MHFSPYLNDCLVACDSLLECVVHTSQKAGDSEREVGTAFRLRSNSDSASRTGCHSIFRPLMRHFVCACFISTLRHHLRLNVIIVCPFIWQNDTKSENDENTWNKTLTKRLIKQNSTAVAEIPKFYYPCGKPYTSLEIEKCLYKIRSEFEKLPGKCVIAKNDMSRITKACGLPLSWKEPLRQAAIANRHPSHRQSEPVDVTKESKITCDEFLEFWRNILSSYFDEASRVVAILSRGQRKYLVPEDFISMIQDVVECHPGLMFLKEAIEFHSRYVHTVTDTFPNMIVTWLSFWGQVIARIFYCVNRSWSGKLTASELRKSNFLEIVALLDEEEDINQITEYFSYEHFYVIYCKFWELDKDHDLIIDKHDLSRHNDSGNIEKLATQTSLLTIFRHDSNFR